MGTPPTILIVDDDEINRAILENIFSPFYTIEERENGKLGLEAALSQRDRLCAVLLDVVMPEMSGIEVLRVSARTGEGIDALRERICGKVSAFAGNSGVGKSSVLNRLDSSFGAEVGAISDRIGRGRHTTRHVELHPIEGGGYIADTPGFSSFETEQMDLVLARDLEYAFPEFAPYLGQCRFTGCAHVKEKGCAILAAVENGEIAKTRHESYVKLYESVKDLKEWELTKGGTR